MSLRPEDEARLRDFAAANPEIAKRYAEKSINPDLFTPKYKMALAVDCPFCRAPFEYIEDRVEDGQTVYVVEPCGCYLTTREFEFTRAQILAWQDYVEDPDCHNPADLLPKYLPKPPWWTRAWRWLTRRRR